MNQMRVPGYTPGFALVSRASAVFKISVPMDLDRLVQRFSERPIFQRLFLAFTLGLFISCSVKMAGAQPDVTHVTPAVTARSQ